MTEKTKQNIFMKPERLPRHRLEKDLDKLANRANKRLAVLEKAGLKPYAYKQVNTWAYDDRGFIRKNKDGKPRFSRAVKNRNREELEEEYKKVTSFLNSKTSTKTGVMGLYKERYERYKEKNPMTQKSFDEFIESAESAVIQHFIDIYGSSELNSINELTNRSISTEEFETVLRGLGFTEKTTDIELDLEKIYNTFENYKKRGLDDESDEI